ncbi:hypothetical protein EDC96DRAFT_506444 [Choanephora cucurbitarum]|nr:hypothetical protein EDC96DRAFT_506444 [Choanephora cucurbitarum]
MSSNPPPSPTPHSSSKQPTAWFSNILRPRASSISVEACLNLSSRDPSQPLDARPVLPLLEVNQPLASRCKHLQAFSDICKNYRFTHLENVFFTVQDILQPNMPQEARHTVFEFMQACIMGQYADLGMARVTFYALLRSYTVWDDFNDMYRVLFALCKGGRDISGFEKNVCKLLIHWLEMAIEHQPSQQQQQTIPYLSEILHLLTVICKFNFALFEDDEVTQILLAVHQAFFSSHQPGDRQACLEFTDIVVRYRFVPFEALTPFLDMLASSVILLPPNSTAKSTIACWPIYQNLLRSHCAHSAILTICRFIDQEPSKKDENVLIKGAMRLLSETAWGKNKTGVETYMLSDSVILMYLKRAASKGTDTTHGTILECLMALVESEDNDLGLMEWETVWDIIDLIVQYILKITDNNSNYDVDLFNLTSDASLCILQFSRFSQTVIRLLKNKLYKGPLIRFMQVLYELRGYCDDNTARLLLEYYVTEHSLLPSTENWLTLLQELTNMFFIHTNPNTTTSATRLLMLQIVSDVCASVKDFYSEDMYESIVIPMMQMLPKETDHAIRQLAIDLIVSSLSDCQNESIFERLVSILGQCTTCSCVTNVVQPKSRSHPQSLHPHRSVANTSNFVMDTASDAFFKNQTECTGVPATLGLSEVFENLLLASNGKLCQKTFAVLTEIANNPSDLACPYGGSRIVALDLFLRLRCPTNHHIYLIEDTIQEENSVIAFIRSQQQKKQMEAKLKRSQDSFMPGPAIKTNTTTAAVKKPVFYPNATILSYSEDPENDIVLDIDQMLQAYIQVLSDSPNWVVVLFVLRRMSQQLSNKHLFCGASPAVNKLRRLLVRWTSTRKFLENVSNIPPQIKRNDLTVHAYNLLTVLISYRRIFTEPKQDQDEIVYAFYVGIMQVTSATRLCINSLSVCCHEMPLSVTKMLNEILQRMSQIISVSSVSVHILEFLSALARLPDLYANFTGDMYKPVFAIALNYLQHSRSQQQQSSPLNTPSASPLMTSNASINNANVSNIGHSVASPTLSISGTQNDISQGALKQYVLIMAYLVITVWFTAIPLRERRKHVPFIVQRLLSGISLGKPIDEQTYTCIDMLSRFTFADVGLSPEKSIVSKILMGDGEQNVATPGSSKQDQRTWVYGHTLLTLRTAKSLGWVEVTIRRPSGTVSMMCHVENKIKSDDIDYRTLPALLMMQYQPNLIAHQILKDREEASQEQSADHAKESEEQLEQKEEEEEPKVELEQEGSALGITFDDDDGSKQRFPAGAPTRRPSDQAVVSATVATRSEGLVMAPSTGPPPASPAVTISSAASMSPGLARRPSLSQKGLIDILNKTSSDATNDTKSPSTLLPQAHTLPEETNPKQAEAAAHASVHSIMSEPKRLPSIDASVHPISQPLRKTDPSIDPSFLYLQFNNYPDMARAMDISPPLPNDDSTARTLATFDRIPVVDFHKIGVLYVGKGQTHEVDILANTYGSPDYVRFLNALGTIQQLRGRTGNSGGLDREMDIDGPFAYFWKDDVTEAVFHVATLMPTDLTRDPQCSAKKRHIGNDYVSIVYNDSGMDYAFDTLPSQFNFINIVVSPHSISTEAVSPTHAMTGTENTFFKVEMQKRPDMPDIGPMGEPKLVSAQSLPGFVRGAALHANIFAQVFWQSAGAGGKREYVSHWRERLRQILRVKERLAGKSTTAANTPSTNDIGTPGKMGKDGYPYEALLDFTKYT